MWGVRSSSGPWMRLTSSSGPKRCRAHLGQEAKVDLVIGGYDNDEVNLVIGFADEVDLILGFDDEVDLVLVVGSSDSESLHTYFLFSLIFFN